jgi:hypothetical protein
MISGHLYRVVNQHQTSGVAAFFDGKSSLYNNVTPDHVAMFLYHIILYHVFLIDGRICQINSRHQFVEL